MKKQLCEFFSENNVKSATVFGEFDEFNQAKYWLVERIDRSTVPREFSVVVTFIEQEAMDAAHKYVEDVL